MRLLLYACFGVLTSTTMNNFMIQADLLPQQVDYQTTLRFLLLGDWGKGGNGGGYTTSHMSDNNKTYDDDHDEGFLYNSTSISSMKSLMAESRGLKNNKQTYQAAVASAMGSYSESFQPSFVIALGDNFYSNGVSSSTDAYWDYLWTNVYLDYYKDLRIPWYPVFGNHDYGYGAKGVQAQLDRSLIDDFWSFKSTNYSKTYDIPNGGTVIIIFVDTTTLAPSVNKCCNENGGISVAVQTARIKNQLEHIDAMLDAASQEEPTWLLVAGHYPIFSVGEHGDTSELKDYLLPLLQKYNVDAYFCGHDHLSEHLSYAGTHYFVAGGGSMTDYVGGTSSAKTLWTGEGYSAFASALATENELTITFIDINNDVKYTHTLTNSKDRVVPSVSPSQGPMAAGPLDEAAKGKFAVLVVSGKIVAVSLVLIAIVFAYDSRWRRKLRRSRKRKSLLSSYMSPDSSFNEFMAGSKYYPMKSSSRIKEEPKVDLLLKEEPYKAMISAAISAPPSRNYSGFEMKRGLISFPVADKPISFDDPRLPSTQDLTFSEVGSVVSVKSERSLDGKIFENVSPVPVANHKRARTSFF